MISEIKGLTLEEIEKLVSDSRDLSYNIGLSIDQLNWLLYYMCVKDEEGKWHGLSYSNYNVIFDGDRIWLKLHYPLYTEKGDIIPFKDMYLVKGAFPSKQEKVSEHIMFPKYTGYQKVLNKEMEDLL